MEQIRLKMVEEAHEIFIAERKKKRIPKGQPEPVFDPSHIIPRLPDDSMVEAFHWRMQ